MRNIDDILRFRTDISPFLVHLTKTRKNVFPRRAKEDFAPFEDEYDDEADMPAKDVLKMIIGEKRLVPGDTLVSDAKFGINTLGMSAAKKARFFGAISFTETPLAEVHSLLEIARRQVNLEPYGLVFLKERLRAAGVMPVWYVNNENGDKIGVVRALCSLINSYPEEAEQILPLIAAFGQRLTPPRSTQSQTEQKIDFSWEREWRWPAARGPFEFTKEDVFVGLCPHEQIPYFERLFTPVKFIDPRRAMKWYASELAESRRRLKLKFSVV